MEEFQPHLYRKSARLSQAETFKLFIRKMPSPAQYPTIMKKNLSWSSRRMLWDADLLVMGIFMHLINSLKIPNTYCDNYNYLINIKNLNDNKITSV